MPIIFQKHYTRSGIQKNRNCWYVFGDNMMRYGYGGQAKEARGEFNAIGIPTKWSPHKYFSRKDVECKDVIYAVTDAFNTLETALKRGEIVVWPEDGIGTGLAELPTRCPGLHSIILASLERLKKSYP